MTKSTSSSQIWARQGQKSSNCKRKEQLKKRSMKIWRLNSKIWHKSTKQETIKIYLNSRTTKTVYYPVPAFPWVLNPNLTQATYPSVTATPMVRIRCHEPANRTIPLFKTGLTRRTSQIILTVTWSFNRSLEKALQLLETIWTLLRRSP